jgi:DNA-binding XRE family transcriptional regulator
LHLRICLINISRCKYRIAEWTCGIRLRHEKGLAQDHLAYEAGVSRSDLSQLEKGAFYASLKILEKLAKALGVEP